MRHLAAIAVLAAAAATAAVSAPAAAQAPARFSILRDGDSPIGHHSVAFSRDAQGNMVAQVDIDIRVRVAFVTVYRYSHRSREVWRDGRLIALDSTTDDNGTQMAVRARATPAGLEVVGPQGRAVVPADIRPTSWWRADTVRQRQLLDSQDGRILTVAASPAGTVTRSRGGQPTPVTLWRMSASGRFDDVLVGYTPSGEWASMQFRARGTRIDYVEPGSSAAAARVND
ncbi:MAG: hypothetical protein JNL66_25775 [Alphaproteobacteria bacterium]|nr:hypothetical protein [Alphaproteobacteria bacterium]